MSVRVMSLVWDSTVPAPERFTLLALADRADEDGRCWPSIPMLARKCRTGESTIRRHLTALRQQGVVRVEHRLNNSSVYTINLAALRQLREPQDGTDTPSQPDTPCQIDTPSQSERNPSQIEHTPSQSERLYIKEPSKNHQRSSSPRARAAEPPLDPEHLDLGRRAVAAVIPTEHPTKIRQQLAIQAAELAATGTAGDDITAGLYRWLAHPNAGPRLLPSLVSDVIRERSGAIRASPRPTLADKAAGWLAYATPDPTHTPPLRALPGGAS